MSSSENWPLPVKEKNFDNASKVVKGLYDIERTGWVKRGVENPETVGDHIDALISLGEEIADKIPELDKNKFLRMLQIHDWPEHIVGDIVTATVGVEKRKEAEDDKIKKELVAMKNICADLGEEGEEILALWLEYEEGKTLEANIAKQLDKLQAVLKSQEYEQNGKGTVVAKEFFDYAKNKITHPVLVEILEKIDKK